MYMCYMDPIYFIKPILTLHWLLWKASIVILSNIPNPVFCMLGSFVNTHYDSTLHAYV